MACSPEQRALSTIQQPPIMHRPLLCRASFVLGLLFVSHPVLGQLPAGQQQPSQTPANQPAPGTESVPGGPLGSLTQPVTPEGTASPAIQESEPSTAPSGGPALPPDYEPPGTKPAIMTNVPDPRRSKAEMDAARAELRRAGNRGIDSILLSGNPSDENKAFVAKWAELQVDRLAAAESKREISDIGAGIASKLLTAASQQSNPNRQEEFRRALAEAMTKELREALLNNNFYVRTQAAALLGSLNLLEAPVRGNDPAVAYTPAIEALLDGLEDREGDPKTDKALTAIKIMAARGIRRLAQDSPSIDAELRYRAADVMIQELARADTFFWYQVRLAEALAAIGLDVDRARNPVVVTALMSVISDKTRHCEARAAAANALSRTPITSGTFDEVAAAKQILAMGHDFALNYNKSPSDLKWRFCFLDLLKVFEVGPEEESGKLDEDSLLRSGTLPAPYQAIQERLMPVIDHVLAQKPGTPNPKPIPNELLQPLNQPLGTTAAASTN